MKRFFLAVLGIFCVVGLVGGCFLSRAEQSEWEQIGEQIEQYEPQLLSILKAYGSKQITEKAAAKQVSALASAKASAQERQVKLAEIRARNFWAGVGVVTNILLVLATRGILGARASKLAGSVQEAKDAMWPKKDGVNPDERDRFNSLLAVAEEAKGIRGWVNRLIGG